MKLKERWHNFIEGREDERDTEFLPAILEVTETPPSPVGRLVLYSVLVLLSALLVWSFFGHIDEPKIQSLLQKHADEVTWLGSYVKGEL